MLKNLETMTNTRIHHHYSCMSQAMNPWDSCNDGSDFQRSMLCQQFFLKVGFLAESG